MTSHGILDTKEMAYGAPGSIGGSPAISTSGKKPPDTPSDAAHQKHLENLRTFQDLVGIRTPTYILSTGTIPSQELLDLEKASKANTTNNAQDIHYSKGRPKRSLWDLIYRPTITNDGIYGRAIDEELKARIGYTLSNCFINTLYIAQIFVAATITGLASYSGHEIPLTVLGAVNAVLAGLMALLKGQGLPVRLRRSRDQFQNVMKSIENTERMFARYVHMGDDDKKLHDPFKEFQFLEDLYDAAKKDQQASKCICFSCLGRSKYEERSTDAPRPLQIIQICTQIPMRGLQLRP
jgi:hypothetical protein